MMEKGFDMLDTTLSRQLGASACFIMAVLFVRPQKNFLAMAVMKNLRKELIGMVTCQKYEVVLCHKQTPTFLCFYLAVTQL